MPNTPPSLPTSIARPAVRGAAARYPLDPSKRRFATRRALVIGGLLALCVVSNAGVASASPTPPTTETPFSYTGAEQSFTVPVGVSSVRVQAIGAPGQTGLRNDPGAGAVGGAGADVVGQLPVTAGEVLYVEVGGYGFNGGGFGAFGGGSGGDASDVRTIATAQPSSADSRLLVAAGGGGGGGVWIEGTGGVGGNAGSPGTNATGVDPGTGGAAGGSGTLTGGGAGGASCGLGPWTGGSGGFDFGGAGGDGDAPLAGGGGGGGGYTGGGGGEGSCAPFPNVAGGGGGGGSSFVFGGATFSSFGAAALSTAPEVSITYATPATATPDTAAITFPATQPSQTLSPPQTLTITNKGGNPLAISAATFSGSTPAAVTDHPEDFLIGSSSCLSPVVFEESCQLTVRFAPQGPGTRTGTLQILSNAGAGPTVVTLTGTGGTLPQGPVGEPGTTGSAGVAGATGPQGLAGAAGALGATGATGPSGPAGPQGSAGARGGVGATGKQGPAAVTVCHRRQLHGRFVKACFVRILSAHKSLVSATLTRQGVVYARAGSSGDGQQLELTPRRSVASGRYTLVLVSRSATTRQTILVR